MSDLKRGDGGPTAGGRGARYDEIEGGAPPSPFAVTFVIIAFGAAVAGAAVGPTGADLWALAAITAGSALLMVVFASAGD